jgi:serine/threonine-protein kinase GIN4
LLGFIGLERASSHNSSIVFQKDIDKLLNFTPSSRRNKENKNNHHSIHIRSPPGLDATVDIFRDDTTNTINKHPPLAKSKSQPKVAVGSSSKSMSLLGFYIQTSHFSFNYFFTLIVAQPRKRAQAMPMPDLSPIQASPTTSPYTGSAAAKENIQSFNRLAASVNSKSHAKKAGKERVDVDENAIGNTTPNGARRPFGALNARENLPQPLQQQQRPAATMIPSRKPSGQSYGAKAVKVLGDLETNSNSHNNTKNINIASKKKQPEYGGDENSYSYTQERSKDSTNVKDRMREWEREKERLREMERLEEMERDRDVMYKREKKARKEREEEEEKENRVVEEEAKERKNASHLQIKIPQASNTNNGQDWDKENVGGAPGTSPVLPMFKVGPPLTQGLDFLCVLLIL